MAVSGVPDTAIPQTEADPQGRHCRIRSAPYREFTAQYAPWVQKNTPTPLKMQDIEAI